MLSDIQHQEQELDKKVTHYRHLAYADSTKTVYKSQLCTYLRFCHHFSYVFVPATTTTLSRYVVFLAETLRPQSIDCYLNAIRLLHLELGFVNPISDNFRLNTVLRGIKREKKIPQNPKLPITVDILLQMHQQLDLASARHKAFWAACVCAFFTFFRKATLLPKSVSSDHPLCKKNVQFFSDGAILNVTHTKTIQFGERSLQTPIPLIANSPLCPVTALKSLFNIGMNIPNSAPLFSYPVTNNNYAVLTHNSFVNMLRSVLTACNIPPAKYSGHSFGRGGATFAFTCGLPITAIKLQGDWRSNAFERYLHVSLDTKKQLVNRMSTVIQTPNL